MSSGSFILHRKSQVNPEIKNKKQEIIMEERYSLRHTIAPEKKKIRAEVTSYRKSKVSAYCIYLFPINY